MQRASANGAAQVRGPFESQEFGSPQLESREDALSAYLSEDEGQGGSLFARHFRALHGPRSVSFYIWMSSVLLWPLVLIRILVGRALSARREQPEAEDDDELDPRYLCVCFPHLGRCACNADPTLFVEPQLGRLVFTSLAYPLTLACALFLSLVRSAAGVEPRTTSSTFWDEDTVQDWFDDSQRFEAKQKDPTPAPFADFGLPHPSSACPHLQRRLLGMIGGAHLVAEGRSMLEHATAMAIIARGREYGMTIAFDGAAELARTWAMQASMLSKAPSNMVLAEVLERQQEGRVEECVQHALTHIRNSSSEADFQDCVLASAFPQAPLNESQAILAVASLNHLLNELFGPRKAENHPVEERD